MRIGLAVPGALALVAATLHVTFASTWAGGDDHLGAVALGWAGAIAVALGTRPRPRRGSGPVELAAGLAAYAALCAVVILTADAYRWFDRVIPLASGVAILLVYRGLRGVTMHGRELALLSVPLFCPLPGTVQRAIMPLHETAVAAAVVLRTLGFPAVVDGTIVGLPEPAIEVLPGCSGLSAVGQLLALALLFLTLFPTTWLQKVLVVLSAAFVGFGANAGRVAFLAVVAARAPDDYMYFERYGLGSLVFPVIAALMAASTWFAVLLTARTGRGAANRRPPQPFRETGAGA